MATNAIAMSMSFHAKEVKKKSIVVKVWLPTEFSQARSTAHQFAESDTLNLVLNHIVTKLSIKRHSFEPEQYGFSESADGEAIPKQTKLLDIPKVGNTLELYLVSLIKKAPERPPPPEDNRFTAITEVLSGNGGLTFRDRVHNNTIYRNCFMGSELVNWMISMKVSPNREQSVRLGERLRQGGAFDHITCEHPFEDKDLLYQFAGQQSTLGTWRVVCDGNLRIRQKPGLEGKQIGIIKEGDTIMGVQRGNWTQHQDGWSMVGSENESFLAPTYSIGSLVEINLPDGTRLDGFVDGCENDECIPVSIDYEGKTSTQLYPKKFIDFNKTKELDVRFFAESPIGITTAGSRVREVSPGSQAEYFGVQRGWTITAVNGKRNIDLKILNEYKFDDASDFLTVKFVKIDSKIKSFTVPQKENHNQNQRKRSTKNCKLK
eukprot:TRINITY_DN6813_c0_g1_i1.p1 TRINITY_DN6813_c0_g1~~TRINITY_DN6813_c0_g1_i1.p1  ORF type:complete len:489 (-),score=101.52 TRINITY_DN6813_c0_g1_i1:198-1493(-)